MLSRSYFIPRSALSCWLSIPKSGFRWMSSAGRLRAAGAGRPECQQGQFQSHAPLGCGRLTESAGRRAGAIRGPLRARINGQGEIVLHSQRYRDQGRNRADCLEKLRQLILAVRHAPVRRRRTDPTRASRERRLRTKQHTAEKKRSRHGPAPGD